MGPSCVWHAGLVVFVWHAGLVVFVWHAGLVVFVVQGVSRGLEGLR